MAEEKRAGYLADIVTKALKLITGERQEEYGAPERNFTVIANLWNAYLAGIDHLLTPADVASMMLLFKMSRNMTGSVKQDTDIDLIGYALLGVQIRQRMAERRNSADGDVRDVQQ